MTIAIEGLAHVGIRVHDWERSLRFYSVLGYTKTAGPLGPESVVILSHPSGPEINLVVNCPNADATNVLMDVPDKQPGITHISLVCRDLAAAQRELEAAGFPLSGGNPLLPAEDGGGPVRFGDGSHGIFVRDPDRNVIELNSPAK